MEKSLSKPGCYYGNQRIQLGCNKPEKKAVECVTVTCCPAAVGFGIEQGYIKVMKFKQDGTGKLVRDDI